MDNYVTCINEDPICSRQAFDPRMAAGLFADLSKNLWDLKTRKLLLELARELGLEARRDAIDWALEQLRTALPAIEDEAVDIEVSETARIQALLDAEPIPVWS